jgi:hypothetical protein
MIYFTFLQSASPLLLAFLTLILIIIFYLTGFRVRLYFNRKNPDFTEKDLGTIIGTLLGLLGLLLAFTFQMSSSRFDTRRNVIIEEANNIGTAILRADLYPDSTRNLLRSNFKMYVEERISFYNSGMDINQVMYHQLKGDSISKVLWGIVAYDAKINSVMIRTSQMIPAINAMIDITTTRRAAGEATVPDLIMYFLFALCFSTAFLLGYDSKYGKIDWILVFGLAFMLSFTVYTIIDLDRSRIGLISMDVPHQKIVELLGMFK